MSLRVVPVRRIGIPADSFVDHGAVTDLRRTLRLDAPGILEQIREAMADLGIKPTAGRYEVRTA